MGKAWGAFAADIIYQGAMRVVTPPNQHPLMCLLARRGHDLAPLDRDAARISKPIWRRTIRSNYRISFNKLPRLPRLIDPIGRCGTLTHRQDSQTKRKPTNGIAAAQQT